MACDWPVSAMNGSTATLHGRELPTELPVQTLCTALAETALSYGLRLLSRIWQIGSRQWRDRTLHSLADLPARNFQVVLRLKVLPQLCRRTEISRQAQMAMAQNSLNSSAAFSFRLDAWLTLCGAPLSKLPALLMLLLPFCRALPYTDVAPAVIATIRRRSLPTDNPQR
jgi:hypothetical protein